MSKRIRRDTHGVLIKETPKYPRKTKEEIYNKLTKGMNSPKFKLQKVDNMILSGNDDRVLPFYWKMIIVYNVIMTLPGWFIIIVLFGLF